eukprot:1007870-Ditylum_brightwellii.AAC.1
MNEEVTWLEVVSNLLQSSPICKTFRNAKSEGNYNLSQVGRLTKLHLAVEKKKRDTLGIFKMNWASLEIMIAVKSALYLLVSGEEGSVQHVILPDMLEMPVLKLSKVGQTLKGGRYGEGALFIADNELVK